MNLYIIDGNSYVYRAYYAIRGLTNSKGFPTNAIYGFTNMLLKIIKDKQPDSLVVAFDSPEPTERHQLFENYKANRPETPEDLVVQLQPIRKIISSFNIKIFEMPGYEADDLIGTIAHKADLNGWEVYIVTADKDMLQLVTDNIKIYDPAKDRVLDTEYVRAKFGVGPERVTEFMALTGDAVDNIPGVKGIGEKTAKDLLQSFSSIEELLQHPEKVEKDKLRALISENTDLVRLSHKLATIDSNAPIDMDLQEFRLMEPDWLSLVTQFKEFEFSSMMKLVPTVKSTEREYKMICRLEDLREVIESINSGFSFDTEATGINPLTDNLVGIALCNSIDKSFYIPLGHNQSLTEASAQIDRDSAITELKKIFEDRQIAKSGHNLKYDIMLIGQTGTEVCGALFDTMIASYLLNPNSPNHSLDEVSFEYLSKRKKSFMEVLKKRPSFADVPLDEATAYSAEDAALVFELKHILHNKLKEQQLDRIYFDIEMALIPALIDMEKTGVRVDTELLNDFGKELYSEISSIEKRIYFLSGEVFNINSPKQLSTILFSKLGLNPTKKIKTGFSTGVDVLAELAESHELPREVLHYRSLSKLKSTYIDVLPNLVNHKTGRVHTSFNQTVTATGRLSSSNPNLQNIPIRGEWGKRIRGAFTAESGNFLLSADYSQVELRILAHLSGDEGLLEAFNNALDIHTRTASELYGIPIEKVTAEMRRTAKTVNFGVIYGISSFGLSETLNIERKDADRYIKHYFDRHPGVRTYTERIISDATEKGYVCTLFGRKRPIPELRSQNRSIRQQGERLAVNSPIQGTAADIIKIAMINIRNRFMRESVNAKMVLQVHDELLFELPENELGVIQKIVKEEMEGSAKLSVPIKVDIGYGKNWSEAH